jgi:hypothetical protein
MAQAKRFSVAAGTPPSADEAMPPAGIREAPPVPQEPAQPGPDADVDGGRPHLRTGRAATPPLPELDAAQERRWRREVGVTGLALKAARADVAAREADWARLIADARAARVPERILVAAAADADEDLPDRS